MSSLRSIVIFVVALAVALCVFVYSGYFCEFLNNHTFMRVDLSLAALVSVLFVIKSGKKGREEWLEYVTYFSGFNAVNILYLIVFIFYALATRSPYDMNPESVFSECLVLFVLSILETYVFIPIRLALVRQTCKGGSLFYGK